MPRSNWTAAVKQRDAQAASLGSARHHSNPLPTPHSHSSHRQASPVSGRAAAGSCGLRPATCASDRLCQQHTLAPWRFWQRRLAARGFRSATSATSATLFLFDAGLTEFVSTFKGRPVSLQCPLSAQCPRSRGPPSTAVPCRHALIVLEPLRLGARMVPRVQTSDFKVKSARQRRVLARPDRRTIQLRLVHAPSNGRLPLESSTTPQ